MMLPQHPSADMFDDATGFTTLRYTVSDGLTLSARIYGAHITERLPVICLSGLTRNARDFHELAVYLSSRAPYPRKVVTFDYRGRGASERDPDWRNYNILREADDVVQGLAAFGIERAAFIGTSRGGLIVHVLAATHSDLLAAVVLNDVGPAIEGAGLVQIRTYMERPATPESFEEAAALVKRANSAAFTALDDSDWERVARALYRSENGRPVLDYDPLLARTMQEIDLEKPLPTLWPQFEMLKSLPAMAIRGENSNLLSERTLAEMCRRLPALETVTVSGQGHAPLLETGDLPERIADFLARADVSV